MQILSYLLMAFSLSCCRAPAQVFEGCLGVELAWPTSCRDSGLLKNLTDGFDLEASKLGSCNSASLSILAFLPALWEALDASFLKRLPATTYLLGSASLLVIISLVC